MKHLVLLLALASAPALASSSKKPFGPFDAGETRAVVRQGTKGKARHAHPAVGDAAQVPGEGAPKPALRAPKDVPELALVKPNVVGAALSADSLYLPALIYQHFLTRIDGPRCQHLPTCSRFASQAVARHGALGILMGIERLLRTPDSSAIRRLPEVEGFGGVRGFDPVENYEFWRSELFTGFPLPAVEESLVLPPLPSEATP